MLVNLPQLTPWTISHLISQFVNETLWGVLQVETLLYHDDLRSVTDHAEAGLVATHHVSQALQRNDTDIIGFKDSTLHPK